MVAAVALPSTWAAELTVTSAVYSDDGSSPDLALAAYQALSASQSRNYDRAQDISPRQMVILLDVSERTGASLGQALATGEHESAHTWNDHVRPTLLDGNLGSAAGVWQFQPTTFHSIIKKFGAQLLVASEADAALDRDHMDLGEGPFTDVQVRDLIQETVDDKRGAEDEEIQLLRHNFAVLAFAKHYLSVDSGATTPVEDYVYHFLGASQGRRVLALARGKARDTLCVKPVEVPVPPLETTPEFRLGDRRLAITKTESAGRIRHRIVPKPAAGSQVAPDARPSKLSGRGLGTGPKLTERERIRAIFEAEYKREAEPAAVAEPTRPPDVPPPVSSEWGLPADSPTVTGNLGMFYRDGTGQTQPYTWAELLENLARRVKAKNQPALVRAKYGVGFSLKGGDIPERAFNPKKVSKAAEFRHGNDRTVLVPEALVTGPLSRDETELYKQRLAALASQGDDEPTDTLPPESLSALHHLGLLSPSVQEVGTNDPEVRKALHSFRKKVGKDAPDDPAHTNLLMPAERIALEVYDRRLSRYAALQACQQASFAEAPDLNLIKKMPAGLQKPAAPHIAALQRALAAQGLLKQPVKKSVWRDKKRKKRVSYKTLRFAGKADKATVAALNAFQLRNGLRQTDGILDAVTVEMLGLPQMGPEIFLPLSGPQCAIGEWAGGVPICEILIGKQGGDYISQIIPGASHSTPISVNNIW